MRLPCARALGRGLWGGAQLSRGLWQRWGGAAGASAAQGSSEDPPSRDPSSNHPPPGAPSSNPPPSGTPSPRHLLGDPSLRNPFLRDPSGDPSSINPSPGAPSPRHLLGDPPSRDPSGDPSPRHLSGDPSLRDPSGDPSSINPYPGDPPSSTPTSGHPSSAPPSSPPPSGAPPSSTPTSGHPSSAPPSSTHPSGAPPSTTPPSGHPSSAPSSSPPPSGHPSSAPPSSPPPSEAPPSQPPPAPRLSRLRLLRQQRRTGASGASGASGANDANDADADDDAAEEGSGGGQGPAAFAAALAALEQAPGRRVGRLELVSAALAAMPALGVAKQCQAYNRLLRLLPRGPWVPRGPWQRMLAPFPRQQECGLEVLEQMERYGVMPDAETRFLLLGVFGPRSRPVRKAQRMLYWMPKLRHCNPHPLPAKMPPPGVPTAILALRRIAADLSANITVYQHPVPEQGHSQEGTVQPYIVGAQSPEQQELLAQYGPARAVFVEGPFPLWLRGARLSYYLLRGDPLPPELRDPPPDPERSFYYPLHLELDLERGPWDDEEFDVDEVEEGPVFALCMAGAGDRRTLGRWIAALQRTNPVLGRTAVVFRLSVEHPPHGLAPPTEGEDPSRPSLPAGAPTPPPVAPEQEVPTSSPPTPPQAVPSAGRLK